MALKLGSLTSKLDGVAKDIESSAQATAAEVEKESKASVTDVKRAAVASADTFESAGKAVTQRVASAVTASDQFTYDLSHPLGNPALLPPSNIGAHTSLAQLNTVLDATTGSHQTEGNSVQFYVDGQNALPPILQSIDSATKSICYETYELDGSGTDPQTIVDHLIAAKERGVQVRVVADSSGSRVLLGKTNPMIDQLQKAGIDVQMYAPFNSLSSLDIHRDHRKTIIVDGRSAFVGGMNTGDKYLGGPTVPGRLHDVFTQIQGPAVSSVLSDFLASWKAAGGASASPASLTAPLASGTSATPGNIPVRIVEHTPGQDANIRTTYLAMINHATSSIDVENSYPMSSDLVQALIAAQKRGVQVSYIVGTHQGVIGEGARENFKTLVDAGVHVYLYPGPVHLKSLSVDGQICSVGSSNVDNVALTRNREIISVISDPGYVQSYDQAVFQKDRVGNSLGQKTVELKQPFSEPLWRSVADSVLSHVWPQSLQ